MNLNSQQREQVRLCLLRYGLSPVSLNLATSYLKAEGFTTITKDQVKQEMEYLADPAKGFIRECAQAVSPENTLWKTTATGRDYLAQIHQEPE